MNSYFIAIEPDAALLNDIRAISKDFAERFNSVKAYKNFPHITLIPPFKFPKDKEDLLVKNFSGIKLDTKVFEQKLNGYSSFPNRRNPVIFIEPDNREELQRLYNELSIFFSYTNAKGFSPHITVAYRDLTYDNYEKAWKEYEHKPFNETFTVEKVGLYKHENEKWNLVETISLKAFS